MTVMSNDKINLNLKKNVENGNIFSNIDDLFDPEQVTFLNNEL